MIIRFLLILALLTATHTISYSQLGKINASVEYLEIDTNGYYSHITVKDSGRIIAVCGTYFNSPQCLALSKDYGNSWINIGIMTDEENPNNLDFVDVEITEDSNIVVFSNSNLLTIYNWNLEQVELKYINEEDQDKSHFLSYTTHSSVNGKFCVYQREADTRNYNDFSSISIYDYSSMTSTTKKLDMEKFIKLLEPRDESYYRSKRFDDSQIVSDNCFYATTVMYLYPPDEPDAYAEQKRCLVKIKDISNPEWEVIPLLETDSTAYHFIHFDDCSNGFLSTYKTHNKEYPRLYKTTDGGESWVKIYEDNEQKYVLRDIKRANDSTFFATSGLSNLYRSTDNGISWSRIVSELTERTRGYEVIDENTLLVSYDKNTIARLTINSSISSVEEKSINSSNITYPNPATSTVNIDLPSGKYIKVNVSDIKVYNIMGNELSTEGQIIIGNDKLTWNCASKPSGVYYIKIDEEIYKVIKE